MKQVIFLCLLSLTLCLSKPAEQEIPTNHAVGDAKPDMPNQQAPVVPTVPPTTPKPVPADQTPQLSTKPPAQTGNQKPVTTEGNKKDDDTKPNTTRETTVQTSTVSNNTPHGSSNDTPNASPNNIPNASPNNIPNASPNNIPNVSPNNIPNASPNIPNASPNNTNADVKPAANGNTKPEEIVIPTTSKPKSPEVPKAEEPKTPKDEDKHTVQARGFDGPSFIGGIILSLGLLAIGFMGFKYYKTKSGNYHTL